MANEKMIIRDKNGWLTADAIIELRKQIVLNSVFIADYDNTLDVNPIHAVTFFDGYMGYLEEISRENGDEFENDSEMIKKYDTPENLLGWYGCFDENPLPYCAE